MNHDALVMAERTATPLKGADALALFCASRLKPAIYRPPVRAKRDWSWRPARGRRSAS